MKWPTATLEQITTRIRNGYSVRQSSSATGLPITRIETISDWSINPAKVGYADLKMGDAADHLLEAGDILFSHINSEPHIGKCAIYEGQPAPLVHGMNLLAFRANARAVEPRFLLHFMRSSKFRSQLPAITKRAVNQASVSIGNLRDLRCPLPALREQRRIVELLEQADALRRKRAEADALAARILSAIFRKMFGDPARSRINLPVVALESVADTTSGGTPDRQNPEYFGGPIPWVKSGELKGDVITGTEETISESGLQNSAAKKMPPGTILLALYGATVGATAKLGIAAATNQAICCITPKVDIHEEYLLAALSLLTPTLLAQRVGGAQPNISQQIVRKLRLPLPPLPQQRQFASHAVHLRELACQRKQSRNCLGTLFQTMLHRGFTGELTARWREAHLQELLAEMELQAKALNLPVNAN